MREETRQKLVELLTFIAEGRGRFSMDRLKHAENCIEDMKQKANEALEILTAREPA